MAWLGAPVIIGEYALGIALPLVLGFLSLRSGLSATGQLSWETVLGLELLGIAANYIPLFFYAVVIARAGTVKQEGQPEMAHAKRYGVQQAIILVPFLVLALALVQEIRGRQT